MANKKITLETLADNMENKIDGVHEEVIKNSDAFTKLKRYVDSETAAVISHLKRVDEKIG